MFGRKRRHKRRKHGSFPFGILILFGALGLLVWNEGRAVKTARSLDEGSKAVVSVVADVIKSENEGKLVHVSGQIDTPNDAVYDQQLGLAFPRTIKVKREVQMYQWKRERQGKDSDSSYRYTKVWDDRRIDSKNFPAAYQNPPFAVTKQTFVADIVTLNAFTVSASLLKDIATSTKVSLNESHLARLSSEIRGRSTIQNGIFYISSQRPANPTSPQIGDMQLSFYIASPMMVSVVAQQQGTSLVPYPTKSGIALALIEPGRLQASEMFTQAVQENTTMTWVLRGGGLFLLFVAFHSMFYALASVFLRIPVFGGVVGIGATIVSGILAVVITLPTIAVAWIVYRPVIGITLGVAAVLMIVLSVIYAKKRTDRELRESIEKRIMHLAMQKGGKLTVPEVVVDSDMSIETAQQGLDELARKGMAGVEVTDSGVIVYVFSTIQHLDEKASSKDILEP